MLKILFPVLLCTSILGQNSTIVDYFIDLILRTQNYARYYQLPYDARKYLSISRPIEFGEFDYIIIGAGSAGAVVANRLSEREDWNVLLIEAGTFENDFTDIPNMYFPVDFTEYNWGHESIPQRTACLGMVNNRCPYPRGRGIGGTSIINGLVYSRGNPHDFDRWAAQGNPGWSYEEVLPYFIRSENSNIPNADFGYHGQEGPLNVEYRTPYSPQLYAFLQANQELGLNIVDYNGRQQIGVSPAQVNTINGRRHSTGRAFIDPILDRENLKILTKAYVTKILIDKHKVAYGVEFSYKNERFVATTRGEIILSAGSISSPHILLLSGVGPRDELERHNIHVIQELDVGKHLMDHPTFYGFVVETNYTEPARSLRQYVIDYLNGRGSLTMPGNNQGVGFYQTYLAKYPNVPDLEMMIIPANSTNEFSQRAFSFTDSTADALWGNSDPRQTFILYIIALQAISEGRIRLKSNDPFEYPEIDSRFLSDPYNHDIETLYAGVQMAFEIINTEAFRKMNARYAARPFPACRRYDYLSRDYWYCTIRQVTMNIYHPIGTCKMGPNPKDGAVVDNQLRVHGIKNLRVADASVIPFTLAGHPNAPAILIGEIVSDLIKLEADFGFEEFEPFLYNYF